MVILTARGAGFHTLSPLGARLAPNVFLNAELNPRGRVAGDPAAGWETADSAAREDYGIRVSGADFLRTGPFGAALTVREVTFTRLEEGVEVEIGVLSFEPPLLLPLAALRDDAGALVGWEGALAPLVAEAVRREGFAFEGGAGDDVFDPASALVPVYGPVVLEGRGGNDTLVGGRTDDVIRGGTGDDRLESAGGRDLMFGGAGDDRLSLGTYSEGSVARGGAGRDWISSSNGADLLIGGAGDDRLEGGLGADSFVFRAGQAGHDRIADFDPAEGDRLLFRGIEPGGIEVVTRGDDLLLVWDSGAASLTLEGLGGQEDLLPF